MDDKERPSRTVFARCLSLSHSTWELGEEARPWLFCNQMQGKYQFRLFIGQGARLTSVHEDKVV
jgi:hypothetical protein